MDNTEETGLSDGEECGTPWSDLEEINKTTSMGFEELDETNNFWYHVLLPPPPPQRHIKSIDDMSMKVLIDQPLGVTSSGNGWFVIGGTRMQFMIHTFGRTWIKSRIGF